jgi:hypothetical protein
MGTVRVRINSMKGLLKKHRRKLQRVEIEMNRVINSMEFYDEWLKMKIYGELSPYRYWYLKDLYHYYMDGSETFDMEKDGEIDIHIKGRFSFGSAIAWIKNKAKTIYLNWKYMGRSRIKVGATLTHETGHHKGFAHDFHWTPKRKFSLCYQMGIAYENAYKKIYGG